jgi:hypothetical protein
MAARIADLRLTIADWKKPSAFSDQQSARKKIGPVPLAEG